MLSVYHKCVHCADLRPKTEVNGDMLECGACGLFSRIDIKVNVGTITVENANLNEIKRRLQVSPTLETATEVQLYRWYQTDIAFLLRELGEL